MQKELPDWCAIFQEKWSRETPEWREQLVEDLGVTTQTVYRWMKGQNPPEGKRKLIILEKYIPEISSALHNAFPAHYATAKDVILRAVAPTYARVHRALATTDKDMIKSTVTSLVLSALIHHLDIEKNGIMAILGQLRSSTKNELADQLLLDAWSAQGTGLWQEEQAKRSYLVGNDSLCAVAVSEGRPTFYPRDRRRLVCAKDVWHIEQVQSAAAYPVLRSAQVAGVLFICSPRRDYFTIQHREIIEQYVLMLSLAFRDKDFYARTRVHLHPSDEIELFADYQNLLDSLRREYPNEARSELLKRVAARLRNQR